LRSEFNDCSRNGEENLEEKERYVNQNLRG